jgi:hypothetical protein
MGPSDFVDPAIGSIPGAEMTPEGMWRVPCNTTATFSLTFSGKEWVIPPHAFLYMISRDDPNLCYTGIQPAN